MTIQRFISDYDWDNDHRPLSPQEEISFKHGHDLLRIAANSKTNIEKTEGEAWEEQHSLCRRWLKSVLPFRGAAEVLACCLPSCKASDANFTLFGAPAIEDLRALGAGELQPAFETILSRPAVACEHKDPQCYGKSTDI